jgi:hypothetical protein
VGVRLYVVIPRGVRPRRLLRLRRVGQRLVVSVHRAVHRRVVSRYGLARFPNPPHTVYRPYVTVYCATLVTFTGVLATVTNTSQTHCSARLRPTVYSYTLRSTRIRRPARD